MGRGGGRKTRVWGLHREIYLKNQTKKGGRGRKAGTIAQWVKESEDLSSHIVGESSDHTRASHKQNKQTNTM